MPYKLDSIVEIWNRERRAAESFQHVRPQEIGCLYEVAISNGPVLLITD